MTMWQIMRCSRNGNVDFIIHLLLCIPRTYRAVTISKHKKVICFSLRVLFRIILFVKITCFTIIIVIYEFLSLKCPR